MSNAILELGIGDASLITLELYDDVDTAIVFAGGERATFVAKASSSAAAILDLDTTSELTVVASTNQLQMQLTQVQADALVAGAYIGQCAIEISAGQWRHSKRFDVVVTPQIATNLA